MIPYDTERRVGFANRPIAALIEKFHCLHPKLSVSPSHNSGTALSLYVTNHLLSTVCQDHGNINRNSQGYASLQLITHSLDFS